MKKISIVVADDHKLFRSGITDILKSNPLFVIKGEAGDGVELIELYKKEKPNIIIVDISMPVLSGIEAVKKIREFDPGARALFLSMYDSEEYVYAVLVSGGVGLVNKNIDKQELFDAIIKICEGKNSFKGYTEEKLEELKNRFVNYHTTIELNYDNLTEREKQVLFYIGRGYTSLEIAETLNLGKRTIDSFRTNIIEKLKLKSLPDLVRFAIQFSTLHKDFLKKI